MAGLFICVLFVQSKDQDQVKTSEEKVVYAQYFNKVLRFLQKESSTVCRKKGGKLRAQRIEQVTTFYF